MRAFSYPIGPNSSTITQIRQTADGGYIAVGSATGTDLNLGAYFKLGSAGTMRVSLRELRADLISQSLTHIESLFERLRFG